MQILVVGPAQNLEEFRQKFPDLEHVTYSEDYNFSRKVLQQAEVVFDFFTDESMEYLSTYLDYPQLKVFANVPKTSLAEAHFLFGPFPFTLFGFNGLPTFVNRELFEVSLLHKEDEDQLASICGKLGTDFQIVQDRVGMVTPRIIAMIINEAYYTVQEGTATPEAIDQGMKLGTNYPYGPFEWTSRIGVTHVYELLESLYQDTQDPRYMVCPTLKRAYFLEA